MDGASIVGLMQKALFLTFLLCAPAIGVAALVGLLMAVLQAVTQIQDQSISQALKFAAVLAILAVLGSWMGSELLRFGEQTFRDFPSMVNRVTNDRAPAAR